MNGVYRLIHESAGRYPDSIFVKNMDHSWTYREVECMAQKLSGYLLNSGVQKGDRIVIFCNNSVQYIAAFFGILCINAVAVPVNPARMTESVLYIVDKCAPGLILACDSTIAKLNEIEKGLNTRIINIDYCNQYNDPGHIDFDDCNFAIDENDVAEILFTSGTTAEPKGIMLTHMNLLANTEAITDYLKLTCQDSVLMTLPFTYSYGNSILLTHTCAGASIILENSAAYPYKVLQGIKNYRASGFSTVGSYIGLMLKYIKSSACEEKGFDQLRYITLAGEAANINDISLISRLFPYTELYIMYGQTEASARLSYLKPELLHSKPGSVGRGLRNVELRVVDNAGRDIETGEMGEIIARGPSIMKGYWKDPAATSEVLREGWLYTGDYATVDEEGYIYIKGRKADIIKYMGHRLSPAEIENVINSCSYIKESAVIESTMDGQPVIKAFIVFEKECSMEEIKKDVLPKLPVYMRPQVFEIVSQLPRTDSGKIRRSALRRIECVE